MEGRITNVLAKYGGKRIVAGKNLRDIVFDLVQEINNMKADGLL